MGKLSSTVMNTRHEINENSEKYGLVRVGKGKARVREEADNLEWNPTKYRALEIFRNRQLTTFYFAPLFRD